MLNQVYNWIEGFNTLMSPNYPRSKLIYHDGMIYEGWIGFRFTLVHKGYFGNYARLLGDGEQGL